MSISFVERIKFEKENSIIIYRGKNHVNQAFFAYILCDKNGLAKMRADHAGNITAQLNSYGKVIYGDDIADPDEKAEEFLGEFVKNYPRLKDQL